MRIKPDIYDFSKETNLQDNVCNIVVSPLFTRTRQYCKLIGEAFDKIDWEKRVEHFKLAFFTLIWQAYEKLRRIDKLRKDHKSEDWNLLKNKKFHPKFKLHDESFLLRLLPNISNSYLSKMDFRKKGITKSKVQKKNQLKRRNGKQRLKKLSKIKKVKKRDIRVLLTSSESEPESEEGIQYYWERILLQEKQQNGEKAIIELSEGESNLKVRDSSRNSKLSTTNGMSSHLHKRSSLGSQLNSGSARRKKGSVSIFQEEKSKEVNFKGRAERLESLDELIQAVTGLQSSQSDGAKSISGDQPGSCSLLSQSGDVIPKYKKQKRRDSSDKLEVKNIDTIRKKVS